MSGNALASPMSFGCHKRHRNGLRNVAVLSHRYAKPK